MAVAFSRSSNMAVSFEGASPPASVYFAHAVAPCRIFRPRRDRCGAWQPAGMIVLGCAAAAMRGHAYVRTKQR